MRVKLLKKAIEVNKKTKATIFFDYSGHVDAFSVRIYPYGWVEIDILPDIYAESGSSLKFKEWKEEVRSEEIYSSFIISDINEIYQKCMARLDELLEGGLE